MALPPIALQLYSVREELSDDLENTLRKVREMGYGAVQPTGVPASTSDRALELYKGLDFAIPALQGGAIQDKDKRDGVADLCRKLGTDTVIGGLNRENYASLDDIKKSADLFNEAHRFCKAQGLKFGIHNHWWEYVEVQGLLASEHLDPLLDPGIFYEIDTYWVRVGGVDPAQLLKKLGPRAPLLHIKDGPGGKEQPMTAVGKGIMDWKELALSSSPHGLWWIVEIDRVDGSMMQAVEESYKFLTTQGFTKGTK